MLIRSEDFFFFKVCDELGWPNPTAIQEVLAYCGYLVIPQTHNQPLWGFFLVCKLRAMKLMSFIGGKVNRVVRTPGWLHTRDTRAPIESLPHGPADHGVQTDNHHLSHRYFHVLSTVNEVPSISYWGKGRGRNHWRKKEILGSAGGVHTFRLGRKNAFIHL